MRLKSVFNVIQGHQITDEELYKTEGNIPVYTGRNELKGHWNKSIVDEKDLPCLTYPSKAFGGEIFIKDELFDANNTAILIPKEDWRDKLNLNWISRILGSEFLKVATSKEGVSYLNKEIVEEIEIDIPKKDVQEQQYSKLSILERYHWELRKLIDKIEKIKSMDLFANYNQYQIRGIPIRDVIDCMSGNSGLTERFIYQKSQHGGKRYVVLSSSTEENTKMGELPKCEIEGNPLKIFEGKDGLLVVRNGKAGTTLYLPRGDYTINDHAYVLSVKDACEYEISLKWLSIQYKQEFLEYSSSSDNGTWNMTGFFENVKLDIPEYSEQIMVVQAYEQIEKYEKSLKKIKTRINEIFSKTIVQD